MRREEKGEASHNASPQISGAAPGRKRHGPGYVSGTRREGAQFETGVTTMIFWSNTE
jgi:hypothetical protein